GYPPHAAEVIEVVVPPSAVGARAGRPRLRLASYQHAVSVELVLLPGPEPCSVGALVRLELADEAPLEIAEGPPRQRLPREQHPDLLVARVVDHPPVVRKRSYSAQHVER